MSNTLQLKIPGVPQLFQEAIFKTETTLPVVFLGKFGPPPTEPFSLATGLLCFVKGVFACRQASTFLRPEFDCIVLESFTHPTSQLAFQSASHGPPLLPKAPQLTTCQHDQPDLPSDHPCAHPLTHPPSRLTDRPAIQLPGDPAATQPRSDPANQPASQPARRRPANSEIQPTSHQPVDPRPVRPAPPSLPRWVSGRVG